MRINSRTSLRSAASALGGLALILTGCSSLTGGTGGVAAARRVEARFGTSLALVKIHQEKAADAPTQIMPGLVLNMGGGRTPDYVGLILSTNGYVLFPDVLKSDMQDRIEVWVGSTAYPARLIKADDALGMSILKLETDDHFVPVDLTGAADLKTGEWALALIPTGEETDFQRFTSLFYCRGEVGGRYRRFALSSSTRDARGTLVCNFRGDPVGIATVGDALALADLREDLQEFLAGATDARSAEAEEKQKGWIGAYLEPINKDLAKARGLPGSGLWILHADADGPAYAAGLRPGDLVTAVNGQPLKFTGNRAKEFFLKTLRPRTGTPFEVTVRRAGASITLRGTVTKRPEPKTLRAEDMGVTVQAITDSDFFAQNLATREGVKVTEVSRGSAAAMGSSMHRSLLMKEDVIVELAGAPTPDIASFSRALESVRRDHTPAVLVKYRRGAITGFAGLNLKIGEKDNGGRE